MSDIESQVDYYESIGFSERIGYGDRPAVLVIDMCRGITEAGSMQSSKHLAGMGAS